MSNSQQFQNSSVLYVSALANEFRAVDNTPVRESKEVLLCPWQLGQLLERCSYTAELAGTEALPTRR